MTKKKYNRAVKLAEKLAVLSEAERALAAELGAAEKVYNKANDKVYRLRDQLNTLGVWVEFGCRRGFFVSKSTLRKLEREANAPASEGVADDDTDEDGLL